MEAHRGRRTRDRSRKAWYSYYRRLRFARWLGFATVNDEVIRAFRIEVI